MAIRPHRFGPKRDIPETESTKLFLLAVIGLVIGTGLVILLVFFIFSVAIPDLGGSIRESIQHFQNLFRRADFIPINSEFIQLMLWAVFIGWALYMVKCAIYRRNNRD